MQGLTRLTLVLNGLLLIMGLLSGCGQDKDASAAGKTPPKEVEVGVVVLKPETITISNSLPARVVPSQIAEVRPQVNGIIREQLFKEGSQVRKGAPLYQIDSATYQAALETVQAQLAKAQTTLEAATDKVRRSQELANRGLISRDSFDDQITAQKQAQADVGVAQAALKNAKINLDYTVVKAPISGFVGRSNVTVGALVTANQTSSLVTIQQLEPVWVDITQGGQSFMKSPGQKTASVDILMPDGSTYPYTGKMEFADLTVDQSTGAVTVRAEFPNPEQQLLPGMFVRAKLEADTRTNALLIPQQGLIRKANGDATVWVVTADNTVESHIVQATQAIGDKWIADSGVNAGDQIVVDGLQKIKPGAKVKPIQLASKPTLSGSAPTMADKPAIGMGGMSATEPSAKVRISPAPAIEKQPAPSANKP